MPLRTSSLLRLCVPLALACALTGRAEPALRTFDLPADQAERSLRLFAAQSGLEVLFSRTTTARVRTNPLRGDFEPLEAVQRLLAGTRLVATRDARSGAIIVSRAKSAGPAPAPAAQEPSPTTNMNSKPTASRLLAALALTTAAVGQTPAPSTGPAEEAETILLSPFEVNTEQDSGYIASNSLVGGRISTNLLTTPSDVSVLTREFLNDIAVDTYQEASIWLTGATVIPNPNVDFGNDVSFRGLGNVNGGYPSRNYFRYNNGVDGYIADRLESARGPNSLLFGDGVVAGVLNTITKRARFDRNEGSLQIRVDSEGGRRSALDVNRAFGKNLAVRVNLLHGDGRNWVDTFFDDRRALHLAAAWRPWKGGELRTEFEWMRSAKNFARRFVTDNASNWNGTFLTAPLTGNPPAGSGISRFTTDRLVVGAAFPTLGIQNFRNLGASNGSSLSILPDGRPINNFPSVPRNFSIQPPNVFHESNYRVLGAYFTQQLGDFTFELAAQRVHSPHPRIVANFNRYTVDVNAVLPDGSPNPKVGQLYSESTLMQTTNQDNRHTDYRLAAVYVLPVKNFSQRFNVIASHREELFDWDMFRYARSNNPAIPSLFNNANTIFVRRYLNDPAVPLEAPVSGNGIEVGTVPIQDRFETQELDTLQFASVGSYWEDRISVIGGVRRDNYKRRDTSIGTRLPNGMPDPAGYLVGTTDVDVTTYNIGAVVFPIRSIGLYANYADSFNPAGSGTVYLDGTIVQPTTTVGKSGGLRFSLAENRLVGSVGYYETFERGRNSDFSLNEINRLWNNLNLSDRQIPGTNYRDSSTAGGTGWEADLVSNFGKSLRIRFNYSLPDNEQRDTLPQLRAYYAANLATWQAGADDVNNPFRTQIQADINTLTTRIENANEGRRINGLQDYTANIFANYTFHTGRLKNVRLGGGANFIGRTIVGNVAGRPYDYVYRPGYSLVSAVAGYSFQWRDLRWDVQLNVSNLFNEDQPVFLDTTIFQGQTVYANFFSLEPRRTTLTATVRF